MAAVINEDLIDQIESEYVKQKILAEDALSRLRDAKLSIWINTQDIKRQTPGSYQLIPAKVEISNENHTFNNKVEAYCEVAFGRWDKLGPLNGEKINLVEHLPKLLPKKQRKVGLFTYQNGIQNSLKDFTKMGESIISHLMIEKPLCIGFYNPTDGIVMGIHKDLSRLVDEWTLNHHSIIVFRQLLITFSNLIPSINSSMRWLHSAHSEGGLIANLVLTSTRHSLDVKQKSFLRENLVTAVYGGVAAIPDNAVHKTFNIYSRDDITMFLIDKYLDKKPKPLQMDDKDLRELAKNIAKTYQFLKEETILAQLKSGRDQIYISSYPYECRKDGYTITVVDSQVPRNKQPFPQKDHLFLGATYQDELKRLTNMIRDSKFNLGGIAHASMD